MSTAFVGIGSNLAEPAKQVQTAFDELERLPQTRVLRRSSLYRSGPLGYAEQPDFINAVAQLETRIAAEQLLSELQEIENRHGRERSFANAPRTLDLDLLLFENLRTRTARLTLPHPRMHERAFVLEPLIEISPDISIPGKGNARQLLKSVSGQPIERIA